MLMKEITLTGTMMKNHIPKVASDILNEKEPVKCGRGSLQMTDDNKTTMRALASGSITKQ